MEVMEVKKKTISVSGVHMFHNTAWQSPHSPVSGFSFLIINENALE